MHRPQADTLARCDRVKLAQLLGMVGSAHDGEALNAARLADRLVRRAGLTWRDVLRGPAPESSPRLAPPPPQDVLRDWPARWRGAVEACLGADAVLSDKDRDFLRVIAGYAHRPSPRQLEWLRQILDRAATIDREGQAF